MKKISFLIVLLLSLNSVTNAQNNYENLIKKSDSLLYKAKLYPQALQSYEKAFAIVSKDPTDLYNAACAANLSGNTTQAFNYLNQSVANGWSDFNHLKTDSDLASLHEKREWALLLAQVKIKQDQIDANLNLPVKMQLDSIYATDQGIRLKYIEAQKKFGNQGSKTDSLIKLMNRHDSINVIRVTKILDEYGWLGTEKVGSKGNQTLFLVIQHAPTKVQQKYLPMMRDAVKAKKAKPSALALLEDRVALREGKKQIYGSQISMIASENKTYIAPMIDPDHVDERRASVGLGKLADYVKQWGIVWDIETYKKQLPEIEQLEKRLHFK